MSHSEGTGARVVHHLVARAAWSAATPGGTSERHYAPPSLAAEGFIHFSTSAQVPATSLRYYPGADDLLLVTVDVDALGQELRWEDLAGTGTYPHLYGPLPLDAVVAMRAYRPGEPV